MTGGGSSISKSVGPEPEAFRLRVTGLRVCLAGSSADIVDDVGFSVRAGEVLGLVGESGSGKTTVALALLGHARRGLRIAAGQVEVDGIDVLSMSGRQLRRIRGSRVSYVPQDPASALNPGLRVGVQVREILKAHGRTVKTEVDKRVEEVLGEVGLDTGSDMLRRYPHQLSGGQQQRFAIAMAFACKPSLIVLDEPTTGLDVSTQRRVLATVRTLCSSYGVGAVYVSHDLAVVGGLAHRVAVMYAGRIMEMGPTKSVFVGPAHPYTFGLLDALPASNRAETLVGIEGQPPSPRRRPSGCPYEPRCPVKLPSCKEEFPTIILTDRIVRCVRASDNVGSILESPRQAVPKRPQAESSLLEVHGLSARYGSNAVLESIDLSVPTEQCVAVVGESGSGKTTLARCIAGLHHDWDGVVEFGESSLKGGIKNRSANSLREIQYVFQNPYSSLNPMRTIREILEQPLLHYFDISRSERSRRVSSVLKDVSLSPDLADRYPDELSGGQRQRVAIGRALVVDPRLLICDEVTSALDVSVQAVIIELLRRLQTERHLSILFITHNLSLVRTIAQSCVVLASGHVVEAGPVDNVLERPTDPYTVKLMADAPKMDLGRHG